MSIIFSNTSKKRVISFTIYGDKEKYTLGLIDNLRLRPIFYPDFCSFIFFDDTVPENIIETCKRYDDVVLINMVDTKLPKMMWRFIPKDIDECVELFISRDCDSRLGRRESEAVYDWIRGKKTLHIIRDHPCHYRYAVYGGLFGLRGVSLKKEIEAWMESNKSGDYGSDCLFLSHIVYEKYLHEKDILVHDTLNLYNSPLTMPFPSRIDKNFHFVGESFEFARIDREVEMLKQYRDRI